MNTQSEAKAYSAKHNYKQLLRINLKNQASITLITTLILLVLDPLILHFSGLGMRDINAFTRSTFIGSFVVVPMNLIYILLLVLRVFGFVHDREGSLFHFSLPVLRSTHFLALVSAALKSILFINIPHMLVSWLHILYNYGWEEELQMRMVSDGKLLVMLFAVFTFVLVISLMTSSRFDAIAYAALITLIWPIVVTLATYTVSSFLPGFTLRSAYSLGSNRIGAIPYSMMLVPILHVFAYHLLETATIIYWTLFTLGLLLISYVVFVGRKAEFTDLEGGLSIPYVILRLISALAIGLILGWVFYIASGMASTFIFLLGILVGASITHILLDMIFRRFRPQWRNTFKGTFVTLVLALSFFFILRQGAFGYSLQSYADEQVTSIELQESWTLFQNQLPVIIRDPEVITLLRTSHADFITELEEALTDAPQGFAYSPAFTESLSTSTGNGEFQHRHSFTQVTMIQNVAESPSLHRNFSWSYNDQDDAFLTLQQDPALLFWLLNKDYRMDVDVVSEDADWRLDPALDNYRYEQLVRAYQNDLNDLDLEERELLGRETPLGVLCFRSWSSLTLREDDAESMWETNGLYPLPESVYSQGQEPIYLDSKQPPTEAGDGYFYEAYFAAPVSERTPRTLRLIRRY